MDALPETVGRLPLGWYTAVHCNMLKNNDYSLALRRKPAILRRN